MERIIFVIMVFIGFFSIILCEDALTWNDSVTHKDFSEYAAGISILRACQDETDLNCDYLKALGLNKGLDAVLVLQGKNWIVTKWLREGAELEDAGRKLQMICGYGRSFNHFHNPLKPWDGAGLNDYVPNLCPPLIPPIRRVTGESSLLWAQDSARQATYTDLEGDWSWEKVREHFYSALTGKDFNGNVKASTQLQREEYFARTFKGLGYQMHLLQDMAVPDHVRNDAHPEDAFLGKNPLNGSAYFETWAKERFRNVNELKSFASTPSLSAVSFNVSYNSLAPITQLFDAEEYNGTNPSTSLTQGLSEYTNANFVSEGTIFAAERYSSDHRHYFPYPKKSSTDLQNYLAGLKPEETVVDKDGDTDTGIWISKTSDGENIQHFVKTGALTKWYYKIFGEGELFYETFYRDEKCHEDYAQELIPRAVGYSAGLLDYFFRGNIDITLPDSGVYAQTETPAAGFTQIKLLAKNTSANGEQMTNGTIELVVGYRRAIDDPFLNYPEDYPFQAENEISYIVVPEKNGIRSIPRDELVELTFDLSQKPIPLWAINVFIRLIYHGRLGNEDGAVVVGFKDISEPTPMDFFNDMDQICLNGIMYTAGSSEAIDQVDTNNNGIPTWDIYPHDLSDIYFRTSSESNPQYASDTNYNVAIPYLNAGYYVRASYILTDYTFSYNSYQTLIKTMQEDSWYHPSWRTVLYPGIAIKNQVEYEEEASVCAPMSAPCHIWWYPTFLDYRGVLSWWGGGIMFINNAYPENSECSCYQGVLRNCMSGTQTLKSVDSAGKAGVLQTDSADVNATKNNAQMLPLTHKRRILADR